jgi:hypothetical protein
VDDPALDFSQFGFRLFDQQLQLLLSYAFSNVALSPDNVLPFA